MARPVFTPIVSAQQGWDATLNDDLDIIFSAPFPLYRADDLATLTADFDPADYDNCLAVVEDTGTHYTSDGADWVEFGGQGRRGARCYRSSNQSISHDTTTGVLFDVDTEDTDGYHDVGSNQDRFTIPTGLAGYYEGVFSLYMEGNATGVRQMIVTHKDSGGTTLDQHIHTLLPPGTSAVLSQLFFAFEMAVTDYLLLQVYQNSTVSLNVQPGASTQRSICGFKCFRTFKS